MIKSLYSGSPSITVGSTPAPSIYGTGAMMGQLRYNPNTMNYEVYDGSTWHIVSQNVPVGLSYDAEEAIRWARDKMREERELKERMVKHPGLKDAYERFQMMDILTKEEDEPQRS